MPRYFQYEIASWSLLAHMWYHRAHSGGGRTERSEWEKKIDGLAVPGCGLALEIYPEAPEAV